MPQNADEAVITQRLATYARFGVHLGLDRVQRLLTALGQPQTQVPIIHVAGTNGKGSVCAYLASVLREAGYRVGRYTSPHLVSWCERIEINGQPISAIDLMQVLIEVEAAIAPDEEGPTQFEVVTAAAWLYFAQQSVDIAVIEVGLGGRLDATNVVDHPLAAVITSISREHWQRLGPTLADIAREKAGVLKPHCPSIIGPLPPEAEAVVLHRAKALGGSIVRPVAARRNARGEGIYEPPDASGEASLRYQLPLPGIHQLTNSAIAIATLHILRQQGWSISDTAIQSGIAKAQWPGRLQWLTWQPDGGPGYPWLIDGAHNPAAAQVLRSYIDELQQPDVAPWIGADLQRQGLVLPCPTTTTWLIGMLSTKDHADVLNALLQPGDHLHLVPVPDHTTVPPEQLQVIALQVCPNLATCQAHTSLKSGLLAAIAHQDTLRVLCGSLYLIGHFFKMEYS
ncbi:MAG: bifunctional folylpolyglutamate synthase/dihydrofolate synthase [Leptolyngbyaceae cyanobacterium]